MDQNNWADATRPRKKQSNGSDTEGQVVELTTDVLQLILCLAYEYLRDTGREMTAPELADKLEHPGS